MRRLRRLRFLSTRSRSMCRTKRSIRSAWSVASPTGRFFFFFIEIWPQEVYYFTGLLVLAAFALFLMNAVAGRVWCGYLCPQTVWTDLYLLFERRIAGDRRERIFLDEGAWSFDKARRKTAKHAAWLGTAWGAGGAR